MNLILVKTLLTLALISPDNWEQVCKWEMEQGDEIIYDVEFEGVRMYHKGHEIIWVMDIDRIDPVGVEYDWNKILIFGEMNGELMYRSDVVKKIK